ncbi:GNAT family N-acetyltransferase [Pseudomonas aeruginosa]|uniref:GNAT family N-acetyltransferase n=1 Tax=Pseudomonas aeruginosa TaxID=287 RepID=UPI000EAC1C1E|nr:GNAT family N-acetyltransferase [Pseudomonas aeruginosa]MBG4272879.1 acetyltransferase [Pseudomonas aeruginosa]QYE75396.1 acetyltransferase [Pseudomonas aeruginosa]
MPLLNSLTVLPLPGGQRLSGDETDSRLSLALDGALLLRLRLERTDTEIRLAVEELPGGDAEHALWAASYWLFARDPDCQRLVWSLSWRPEESLAKGMLTGAAGAGTYVCERSRFWQLPWPWLPLAQPCYPQSMQLTDGKRHPLRRPKLRGEVYRRFDARLGCWISLRTLDIERDLERFHRWQNSPRVAEFWQEDGSLEQHRERLRQLEADPHALGLIGCFDDEPFAYFEAYWAKEDRIAPFYAAEDYDRGIHMLVGEEAHRGPHKVACWLSALVHYLFLDDPRSQRVVAEPRADNARMIGHMHNLCFHCEKEFDFPHKRAALMIIGRERFFERCRLA